MRILIVEDDELVAQELVQALSLQKYAVDVAFDGQVGWELVSAFTYDLILLDVMLPKLDGITLCRRLRSQGLQTPILLVTGQNNSTHKVVGLDAGADDYVTKPFDLQELSARIRALLRRGSTELPPILQWGDLKLDPSTCEVTYQSKILALTPKEYGLLELFLRYSHRVFSRGAILDHLWSFEASPGEETVTSHIKGLRQKLKAAGLKEDPIETVYGIGYRLKPNQIVAVDGKSRINHLSPEAKKQAKTITGNIWQRIKDKLAQRTAIIEQATNAIVNNRLEEELRQQATSEAHKLAGSLGIFNFQEGSRLAREVEEILTRGQPFSRKQKQLLSRLVKEMRRELERAATVKLPEPLSFEEQPLLLIVEPDRTLAKALANEAKNWNWRSQVVANASQARKFLQQEQPDVVLLDFALDANLEKEFTLLGEISSTAASVPILVLTAQDNLIDRVKVARLGGRVFLSKTLPPTQVIEAVTQVLERSRTPQARVLVVDDDSVTLTMLHHLLEPWGIKLTTLDNSLQFWETLEATTPDLLILDVEMPDISGIELCQVVRNDLRWAGLPVLFLTAHSNIEIMQRVFSVGADDYVSKPILGPELVTRIINRIERSRLLRNFAEIDPLTNIANRRKFTSELNQLLYLAARHSQPLCFALLDIDNLKQLNDRHGFVVGDQVLSRLGKQLRQHFQSEDVVARWGGAEFVVAMHGLTRNEGDRRLVELQHKLNQVPISTANGERFPITFSAGIVQYPQDGIDLPGLYTAAKTLLLEQRE